MDFSSSIRKKALKIILKNQTPEIAIKITKKIVSDQDQAVRCTFLTLMTDMLPKFYPTQKLVYNAIIASYPD